MNLIESLMLARNSVEALHMPATRQNLENAMRAIAILEGAIITIKDQTEKIEKEKTDECTQS